VLTVAKNAFVWSPMDDAAADVWMHNLYIKSTAEPANDTWAVRWAPATKHARLWMERVSTEGAGWGISAQRPLFATGAIQYEDGTG
jgi:hypothetical protein